jgi:hypothetical protein
MSTPPIIVRPKFPLVPETIKFSPIDQFTVRAYTPILVFFKLAPGTTQERILIDLEESLAGVLNELPFLAGNIVTEDEVRGTLQIEISDDAGVLLKVQRYIDEKEGPVFDFEMLQKDQFPSSLLDPALFCPRSFIPDQVSPVIEVQANFIKNGLILAIFTHHSVLDGQVMAILVKKWSEHMAAISEGRILQRGEYNQYEVLMQPVTSRWTTLKRDLTEFPGFGARSPQSEQSSMSALHENPESSKLTFGYWYISKENLRKIENRGKASNPEHRLMTWNTILCAWLWRHYSRARRLEEHGVHKIAFFTPVDSRSRMDPPLSPDYPRNAIIYARAEHTLAELFSCDHDALYRIASAINASIEWWSPDRITELLGAMESWPKKITDVERSIDVTFKQDLEVSNTSGLPLYDLHWGTDLGYPCACRLPAIYVLDGHITLLPYLANGGLEFVSYMSTEALENLKKDKDFTEYAQFLCY